MINAIREIGRWSKLTMIIIKILGIIAIGIFRTINWKSISSKSKKIIFINCD